MTNYYALETEAPELDATDAEWEAWHKLFVAGKAAEAELDRIRRILFDLDVAHLVDDVFENARSLGAHGSHVPIEALCQLVAELDARGLVVSA